MTASISKVKATRTMATTVPREHRPSPRVLVIGAGPAGLTAAREGARRGMAVTLLEAAGRVGGLAQTIWREGYGFDIGGHRFFTKFPRVERWWHEVLRDDFITVRRQSRIYYRGKFFAYPLRPINALAGLGPFNSIGLTASYLWARVHPRRPERTFEDWVSNRFGRRLFQIFFKSYTEKVWGMPCHQLSADWAAQRIKSLSLGRAIKNAMGFSRRQPITTLIDQFQYPRRGPGMLWEQVRQQVERHGGTVLLNHRVTGVTHQADGTFTVTAAGPAGPRTLAADAVISSMPLPDLVAALDPAPPEPVQQAARALTYRDLIAVLLVVNRPNLFPDTWIYLHEPAVRASRIQNYGNWSREMVADPETSCLGIEYHCQRGDDLWRRDDHALVALATSELQQLGFASADEVAKGWVVREPRAYPRYSGDYQRHVRAIAKYLQTIPRLITVGRNGMHKYNNQDHSILTAMLAVDNLEGAAHDLWAVNADDEYHEVKLTPSPSTSDSAASAQY